MRTPPHAGIPCHHARTDAPPHAQDARTRTDVRTTTRRLRTQRQGRTPPRRYCAPYTRTGYAPDLGMPPPRGTARTRNAPEGSPAMGPLGICLSCLGPYLHSHLPGTSSHLLSLTLGSASATWGSACPGICLLLLGQLAWGCHSHLAWDMPCLPPWDAPGDSMDHCTLTWGHRSASSTWGSACHGVSPEGSAPGVLPGSAWFCLPGTWGLPPSPAWGSAPATCLDLPLTLGFLHLGSASPPALGPCLPCLGTCLSLVSASPCLGSASLPGNASLLQESWAHSHHTLHGSTCTPPWGSPPPLPGICLLPGSAWDLASPCLGMPCAWGCLLSLGLPPSLPWGCCLSDWMPLTHLGFCHTAGVLPSVSHLRTPATT
jgi:hypothetical protein